MKYFAVISLFTLSCHFLLCDGLKGAVSLDSLTFNKLTYVEKMKIIEEIEQGKSHSQVSRERNIPRSTISTIFKNKFAIKSAFLKSNFSSTLRLTLWGIPRD
ncbi:hypothetical protein LAZ67_15001817 [Cordylochernes scorpioides]|uniref:HTH psq-type domain-containing protein n=1 Tax=Cordylochernes scorpioides TaxID=51811 RepID=A0ABY6L9B0_9ARAC|nr:hypothetical protein LAZ67_15001817 [Cordylochernes scorpioides]